MKKTLHTLFFLSICILLMAFQCSEDDDPVFNCENTTCYLNELEIEINTLANSSVCSDDFECRYIAFGAKPCGGPWTYLTYSTSIDTLQLTDLVEMYNMTEEDFNMNCDGISDCAFVTPPTSVECQNNICTAIY